MNLVMLELHDIRKEYKTKDLRQIALDGVSVNFRDSEFVAILGPSGSGKTTMLNIIGGLDHYDSGDLIIDHISTKRYKDKDWDSYRNHTIGFVFQSYNLIMHQTILANVELALTISGVSKKERKERALKALDEVGLKEQAHKKPNQLSGGQMQRVAIARALVNKPRILLADEPTGALDSTTSVQIMELLKEVAKDRLVIMVTHNPELAQAYATRIVKVKDGKIIDDTDPYIEEEAETTHKNLGKSSMNFFTALSLSLSNLRTKKARTLLTAFAGSIGIIGIALILSLSTGVNDYISSIEENTLSEYPLMIQSSGFNFGAMMEDAISSNIEEKEDEEVGVSKVITSMFTKIGSNDLGALKTQLEEDEDYLDEYVRAIEYSYDIEPTIYSANTEDIHKVHPDESFNSIGLGSNASSNTMMSSMMSTNIFYELPKEEELYIDQYDVKKGRWPKSYDECVIVLSSSGNVSDFIIYALDLRDYSEMQEMINDFANDEVAKEVEFDDYTYDDFLGKSFKIILPSDLYEYDEDHDIYIDRSDDEEYMKEVISQAEDLTIVGIVQAKEDASAAMLSSGINYTADLSSYVTEKALASDILKAQLADPDIDVFSGQPFGSDEKTDIDISSFFSIDEEMMASAFGVDSEVLKEALSDLDTSDFDLGLDDIIKLDMSDLLSGIEDAKLVEAAESNITKLVNDFTSWLAIRMEEPTFCDDYPSICAIIDQNTSTVQETDTPDEPSVPVVPVDPTGPAVELSELFDAYLKAHPTVLTDTAISFLEDAGIFKTLERNAQRMIEKIAPELEEAIISNIQELMTGMMDELASVFPDAIEVDSDKMIKAFKLDFSAEELSEIITAQMADASATYENNLKKLGYLDEDDPSSIDIYPKDFASKDAILDYLDDYNAKMEQEAPEKVISYTDYVGTLMSSVTTIINVISYVLIAFVAISLVVSSIMIGVITYISVLERKKEIGILRAIGASKGNISAVFNAETFIIGLLSGLIGVGISLLALFPANAIIHSIAQTNDVNAKLPMVAAIALITLSVILTLIGGIIPSRKAANSDPVEALRTE